MSKGKYSKNLLLRMIRIQELDHFFTGRGMTRQYLFDRIVYPHWFIDKKTYYSYLRINAKKILRENFGLDWKAELLRLKPIDYTQVMKEMSNDLFSHIGTSVTQDDRQDIYKKGLKH